MDAVAEKTKFVPLPPKQITLEYLLDVLGDAVSTSSKGKVSRAKLKLPETDERTPDTFDAMMGELKQDAKLALLAIMKSDNIRKTDLARELDCRPQYLQKVLDLREDTPIRLDKILEMYFQLGYDFEITIKPGK